MCSKFNITNNGECDKLVESILPELDEVMADDFNTTAEEVLKDRQKMLLWMVENRLPVDITNFDEAKKWILDNIFALAVEYCEEMINLNLSKTS